MPQRRANLTSVLVVDDDATLRDAVVGALADAGFQMHACGSLADARRLMDSIEPTVVVLDLLLDGEIGSDLLKDLAARESSPALVLCSSFALAPALAGRYGVDCVSKPIDFDVLIAKVSEAAEQQRRPRSTDEGS